MISRKLSTSASSFNLLDYFFRDFQERKTHLKRGTNDVIGDILIRHVSYTCNLHPYKYGAYFWRFATFSAAQMHGVS